MWRDGWSEIEAGAGAGEGSHPKRSRRTAQLLVELFLRATWEKLIAQKEQEAIAGQLLFFVGNVCVSLTLISLQRLKNFDMSQYMNQIFPDHLYSVQHPRVSTLEDRTK